MRSVLEQFHKGRKDVGEEDDYDDCGDDADHGWEDHGPYDSSLDALLIFDEGGVAGDDLIEGAAFLAGLTQRAEERRKDIRVGGERFGEGFPTFNGEVDAFDRIGQPDIGDLFSKRGQAGPQGDARGNERGHVGVEELHFLGGDEAEELGNGDLEGFTDFLH